MSKGMQEGLLGSYTEHFSNIGLPQTDQAVTGAQEEM